MQSGRTSRGLRPQGSPILDLDPPAGVTRAVQRRNLDLLAELNRRDLERHPHERQLAARMEAYELAFRMQTAVPGVLDLGGESARTLAEYGVGRELFLESNSPEDVEHFPASPGDAMIAAHMSVSKSMLGRYAQIGFATLWDMLNGKGAWKRNEWVWVYTSRPSKPKEIAG